MSGVNVSPPAVECPLKVPSAPGGAYITTTTLPNNAGNLLLAQLSPGDAAMLAPHLEEVTLARDDVIGAAGRAFTHAYFPDTAVLSVIKHMRDGFAMGIGTVGNEGFVGVPRVVGVRTSLDLTICLIPGRARFVTMGAINEALARSNSLRQLLHRYTWSFLGQVGQTVACNARHHIDQRCARWLLMMQDCVGGAETFPLMHKSLARTIGVRRSGVTNATLALQDEGLIRYRRGTMAIVDRAGLEARACECYQIVRDDIPRGGAAA